MKYILFLFLMAILAGVSYAEFTRFDFSLGRYLVDDDKEKDVNFNYQLSGYSEKDFLVRPVIKNGIIEIYNPKTDSWVSSFAKIFDLPQLEKKMVIRVKGLNVAISSLSFEIFDTSNGHFYKTPEKKVWSKQIYSSYLDKLDIDANSNIAEEEQNSFEEELQSANIGFGDTFFENEKFSNILISTMYMVYSLIFVFIGYFYEKKKEGVNKKLDIETRTYFPNGKIH